MLGKLEQDVAMVERCRNILTLQTTNHAFLVSRHRQTPGVIGNYVTQYFVGGTATAVAHLGRWTGDDWRQKLHSPVDGIAPRYLVLNFEGNKLI